jgi:hypothetical protein
MEQASTAALRGRLPNALFALGSIEALPGEFEGLATIVTVTLPWGSLLRAVALPDPNLLRSVASMCRAGATVESVFSASVRDANELQRLGLAGIDPLHRRAELKAGYAAAGMCIEDVAALSSAELRSLGTTWAKRLSHDVERRTWRVTARVC